MMVLEGSISRNRFVVRLDDKSSRVSIRKILFMEDILRIFIFL